MDSYPHRNRVFVRHEGQARGVHGGGVRLVGGGDARGCWDRSFVRLAVKRVSIFLPNSAGVAKKRPVRHKAWPKLSYTSAAVWSGTHYRLIMADRGIFIS